MEYKIINDIYFDVISIKSDWFRLLYFQIIHKNLKHSKIIIIIWLFFCSHLLDLYQSCSYNSRKEQSK